MNYYYCVHLCRKRVPFALLLDTTLYVFKWWKILLPKMMVSVLYPTARFNQIDCKSSKAICLRFTWRGAIFHERFKWCVCATKTLRLFFVLMREQDIDQNSHELIHPIVAKPKKLLKKWRWAYEIRYILPHLMHF